MTGVVKDKAGAVVPNATITIRDRTTGRVTSATTDNEGRYRVRDIAPGRYDVQVERSGFEPFRVLDVTVETGAARELNIILDDSQPTISVVLTATIKGSVKNARNGRPIENAEVTVTDDSDTWTVKTDGNGKYEKELPVGKYKLSAKAEGFRPSEERRQELRNRQIKTQNFRLQSR